MKNETYGTQVGTKKIYSEVWVTVSFVAVHLRQANSGQLLVPAADEPTPFAASVFPSVRQRASSVRRVQPEAAHAGWSAGWSSWRAGVPSLPGSLEYLARGEREWERGRELSWRQRGLPAGTSHACLRERKRNAQFRRFRLQPKKLSEGFCKEPWRRSWSLCAVECRKVTIAEHTMIIITLCKVMTHEM